MAEETAGGTRKRGIRLRVQLDSGALALPVDRVQRVVGYARLSGAPDPDIYFLGWLALPDGPVPVFDLNQMVCEQPTREVFGSRIVLLGAEGELPELGLLAPGLTDTVGAEVEIPPLDLDGYLPMLRTLMPEKPAEVLP
jgi:chemotaxis signal transduction protein